MPCLAISLALSLAAQTPTQPQRYDLRAIELLARATPVDFDPRRPLEAPLLSELEHPGWGQTFVLDDERWLWADVLLRLTEQFRDEPIDASVEGQELVVEGDEAAHRAARRALEVIERWLGRTWSVELVELPCGAVDGATGTVLNSREVNTLLAAHPSAVVSHRRATTRRVARFRHERLVPHLTDYDVEVSTIGGVADPLMLVPAWGRDAVIWLAPHIDGRVLVSCLWRSGEPFAEPRLRHSFGPDHAPTELASGSGSRRAGSAFLEDGAAFVLLDGGDERRERGLTHGPVLVRIRASKDNEPGAPDVAYLGLGAGARPRPWVPGAYLNRPVPSGGLAPLYDSLEDDARREQPEAPLFDSSSIDLWALLEEIRAAWKGAQLNAFIERLGSDALAVGPPEALQIARDILTARLAPRARTFAVDLRVCVAASDSVRSLTLGAPLPEGNALLDSTMERRLGVTALGSALDLTSAHSWMIVSDVDIEIAQGGVIGDPISGVVDSGSSMRAQVVPRSDGGLVLGLQFVERTVSPPPFPMTGTLRPRGTNSPGTHVLSTEIDKPESSSRDLAEVLTVAPNTWTVVAIDQNANDIGDAAAGKARVVAVRVVESLERK